jgi:hypothetical protein
MRNETELEMAQRHVREGRLHVAGQRELVAVLRVDGHPTLEAESLLKVFEQTLAAHIEHAARLRADLKRQRPGRPQG